MLLDTIFKFFPPKAEITCLHAKTATIRKFWGGIFARFDNFYWQLVRIFPFPSKILQFTLGLWQKFWLAPPLEKFLAAPMAWRPDAQPDEQIYLQTPTELKHTLSLLSGE